MTAASVLIVEDRTALLTRLADVVTHEPGLELVGTATTLVQGLALLQNLRPRILMADIGLPDGSGIELVQAAAAADWQIDSLVISIFGHESQVIEAIRAGASGYVLKGGAIAEISEAIHAVLAGGSPISPTIARYLLGLVQREFPHSDARDAGEVLTEREIEILQAVARGYKRREIAARLEITPGTVGNHIHNIYKKLGVGSNTQAISRATRMGLL